ncbi:hypothetical protein EJ06DRAFT_533595 [Trichodelitschia bisporula]|uniref:Uncharacterized protein n=1 Tax=Trichodelitschia bisporula TaxID=703511 RepID=A0A6G1HLU6_9PEZI|nr:hypothetical protein EJ06DRAFT_533595 [Trichodelitschia bisporula]
MASNSVKIHTSDLPRPSRQGGNTSAPHVQSTIMKALLQSDSVPVIEHAIMHELAASGWSSNLRAYVQALVRSGECRSYEEIMQRVLAAIHVDTESKKDIPNGKNANGTTELSGVGGGDPLDPRNIRVPERVVQEGVKVIRGELDKVCTVVIDD